MQGGLRLWEAQRALTCTHGKRLKQAVVFKEGIARPSLRSQGCY